MCVSKVWWGEGNGRDGDETDTERRIKDKLKNTFKWVILQLPPTENCIIV